MQYGEIDLKYIELTNSDISEEDIKAEIKKLDVSGAVAMSILQRREELEIEKLINQTDN